MCRDLDALGQEFEDFGSLHFRTHERVRKRAGREANVVLSSIFDEIWVFNDVGAVVDAFDADDFQQVTYMLDGILLVDVCMCREMQAVLLRLRELIEEFHRRIVVFIRIQSDTDEFVAVGQGFFQRLAGRFTREVA